MRSASFVSPLSEAELSVPNAFPNMKRSRAEPLVGGADVNIVRRNVTGDRGGIFTSSRSTLQAVPSSLSLEIWLNFDNYKQRSNGVTD